MAINKIDGYYSYRNNTAAARSHDKARVRLWVINQAPEPKCKVLRYFSPSAGGYEKKEEKKKTLLSPGTTLSGPTWYWYRMCMTRAQRHVVYIQYSLRTYNYNYIILALLCARLVRPSESVTASVDAGVLTILCTAVVRILPIITSNNNYYVDQ